MLLSSMYVHFTSLWRFSTPLAVIAGYRSGSGRMYQDGYGKIPESGWSLVSGEAG